MLSMNSRFIKKHLIVTRPASKKKLYNSPGLRPMACQILDIISFFIVVSSLFVRFSIERSLDFVFLPLGPWISTPVVSWYWPSAKCPMRHRADPAPNYSVRSVLFSVGSYHTHSTWVWRSLLFFLSFPHFSINSCVQVPPKIDPNTFKNHFQNRSRFDMIFLWF